MVRNVSRLCLVALFAAGSLHAAADKEVIYAETSHLVYSQTNPCIGTLDLDHWIRWRITQMTDGSGGYHYNLHANIFRFRGYDPDTGTEYSGGLALNEALHVAANGMYPSEYVYVYNLAGLSHGPGPNLLMKMRFRVIVNAPGDAVVQYDLDSVTCIPD